MKYKVKWGIIGLGNIAFEFAKSFYNADNAELIAVASKSKEKLTNFGDKFTIKPHYLFNNYEKILEDKNIDIIYIALPNNLHFEWITKSLEKKKNVLVEKPAVASIEEAEKLFSSQNFKDIFFSEGFMYRYHPQITKVIEIIRSGQIGRLIKMNTNFGINLIYKKNFFGLKKLKLDKNKRIFNKKLGGGVILDQGCYTTSMSILIASLIENLDLSIFKIEDIKNDYLQSNIDVNCSAKINFDNKFISNIATSFTKNIGRYTEIIGENGKIILENSWSAELNKIKVLGKINKEIEIKNLKNIYTLEIENISDDIISGKTEASFPGINKKEILINTKLINNWSNGPK
tara:strand:+ start:449 stop:1483 length:1035 start_codon:yes stop_codon:yes gene_type:complete